jgi:hypothetical protein
LYMSMRVTDARRIHAGQRGEGSGLSSGLMNVTRFSVRGRGVIKAFAHLPGALSLTYLLENKRCHLASGCSYLGVTGRDSPLPPLANHPELHGMAVSYGLVEPNCMW